MCRLMYASVNVTVNVRGTLAGDYQAGSYE